MSASRVLSRCVVTLETEEGGAEQRIDAAAERIDALFEGMARTFVSPRAKSFKKTQVAIHRQGNEVCRVELLSAPPLTSAELNSLASGVAAFVSQLPDVTPREVAAVDRSAHDVDTDPGEPKHDVETREHVARTRPEGVRRRPVPKASPDEETERQPREEVPTRPQDVIAIRRRK